MLFGFGVVSMDTNFTFALPTLPAQVCIVILPLGSGYPSFSKPFGNNPTGTVK
jgi:hypothetical protein